jgi:hypothetical protein
LGPVDDILTKLNALERRVQRDMDEVGRLKGASRNAIQDAQFPAWNWAYGINTGPQQKSPDKPFEGSAVYLFKVVSGCATLDQQNSLDGVPGIPIRLTNPATGQSFTFISGSDGRFIVTGPAGLTFTATCLAGAPWGTTAFVGTTQFSEADPWRRITLTNHPEFFCFGGGCVTPEYKYYDWSINTLDGTYALGVGPGARNLPGFTEFFLYDQAITNYAVATLSKSGVPRYSYNPSRGPLNIDPDTWTISDVGTTVTNGVYSVAINPLPGGTGSGGVGTVTVVGGAVQDFVVTQAGSNYDGPGKPALNGGAVILIPPDLRTIYYAKKTDTPYVGDMTVRYEFLPGTGIAGGLKGFCPYITRAFLEPDFGVKGVLDEVAGSLAGGPTFAVDYRVLYGGLRVSDSVIPDCASTTLHVKVRHNAGFGGQPAPMGDILWPANNPADVYIYR